MVDSASRSLRICTLVKVSKGTSPASLHVPVAEIFLLFDSSYYIVAHRISVRRPLYQYRGNLTIPDAWDDWGPRQDLQTVKVINSILGKEHVDLAVLNGDLVTGENLFLENGTVYMDQMLAPLVNRSIPFASTYGNHDIDLNISTRALLQRENKVGGKLSLTNSMVEGDEKTVGTSNYYIPVYSSGKKTIELILWFFDSRGGWAYQELDANGNRVHAPDHVDSKVVNWFSQTKSALQKQHGRAIPSLAFVHIPIYATFDYQDSNLRDPSKNPGINNEILGVEGHTCSKSSRHKRKRNEEDDCPYTGADSPFMKELVATSGLMAVFSGHDHRVDWCMTWSSTTPLPHTDPSTGNNLHLCFGRHTGYGGYASEVPRGARQIVIHEQNTVSTGVETYIRLENGSVTGHVMLNATYGQDTYNDEQTSHDGLWGNGGG
ncbi:Metallo-dependent phosphatase-like protein [Clohesyomyces aquaticus]|uniref:Metallo-dependent phosphatase-like protein n=1 Tax=Clohesyomyces aquaticus TaxID=1231657 RepID=A0A1Y1ZV74_9PLEO|nr:Metallo-dependent phosphatase-like protein [Clohesyomyces aquaticus]